MKVYIKASQLQPANAAYYEIKSKSSWFWGSNITKVFKAFLILIQKDLLDCNNSKTVFSKLWYCKGKQCQNMLNII